MARKIEVELTFMGESTEELTAILGKTGAGKIEPRQVRGMTGVETVVVCILLAEETAKLINWLVKEWKCGLVVVVNSSGDKVSTEKNCDLPRGSVLMVHPDGTQVTLNEPKELQIGAWFTSVFKAASAKG